MNRAVVFVFVACCAFSALSLAKEDQQSATVTPAKEFATDTPTPPTPTKTTTATPKPTNTTTKAPPTPPKTTTTTPKTTTTPQTTAPPPEPTPSTNLTVGNYSLKTDKGVTCLMAHMSLQIRVARPKVNGTFIVQPKDTKAVGDCKGPKANLTLQFKEGHITFMFNESPENNTVYVNALSFNINYSFSKGASDQYHAKNDSVTLFSAKVGHSYSCSVESIYMGDGLYLDVDKDRLQAFNLTKASDFGVSDPCRADKTDYSVAIGVGVTLLVLIVIVVVVYILSRRKRADGYQSL